MTFFQSLEASISSARGGRRLAFVATAALSGVVAGLTLSAGDPVALLWAIALGVVLLLVAARLVRAPERPAVLAFAGLALVTHMAIALAIQAFGPLSGGFLTGDDASYFNLATQFAKYLRGVPLDPPYAPPIWAGQAYLFGAWVYLEAALFVIFGPDVRIPLLLNAAISVATALLVYDGAARLFSGRVGLVAATIVGFYPSLTLWSSLNLKDALAVALLAAAVSALIVFRERPGPILVVPFLAAEALVTVRIYAAGTVAIAALLCVVLVPLATRRRMGFIAVAGLATAVIVIQCVTGIKLGDEPFVALEYERAAMALGARTGFVPTPTPAPTLAASAPTTAPSSPSSGVTATSSPSAATSAPVVPVATATPAALATVESGPRSGFLRTLAYLPQGLVYAMFSPFPFANPGPRELVAAPEMLGWYVIVCAAVVTIWRHRSRWAAFAPAVLIAGGLILVFALAEGNVGTVFRHRGMVVPFVVLLASPTLVSVWMKVRGGVRSEAESEPAAQRRPL